MSHPTDLDFYLENGSEIVDHSLGLHPMPYGYHLMIDPDKMYFYWIEIKTGRVSSNHWDKWAVYRGAREDRREQRELTGWL